MICKGMFIDEAIGTDREMTWLKQGNFEIGTLLRFFIDRGAVVDKKKQGAAKAASKRKSAAKAKKAVTKKGKK